MIGKKFFAGLIGIACLISADYSNASIITDKLPLLTYSDHFVYTYDKPNGNKKGKITPSTSLVLIKKIQSDGWAYGSYKMSNQNKRINRWFKMSDLQGYIDFENYEATAYQNFTATRTRTDQKNLGHIAKNDKVIVVAEKGDSKKVIFKDENNRYRMGWIPNSVLDENYSNISTPNDEFVAPDYGLNLDENNYSDSDSYNENVNEEISNDDNYDDVPANEYDNYPENTDDMEK